MTETGTTERFPRLVGDLFGYVETSVGPIRTVRAPPSIAGADVRPRGPAPELGQHTAAVLTELGLSADELSALAADEVIGQTR